MKHMRFIWLVIALTAGIGMPAVAQEREQRRELEQRTRELRAELRDLERELRRMRGTETFFGPNLIMFSSNRARLGVVVRTAADEEADAIGAVLESVDLDGAAAEAGLEAGDIIVSFDGEPLTGRYPPADADESEPAIKLIDLVREHEPGDEVEVEYRRGNRTQSTMVTLDGGDGFAGSRWLFTGPGDPDFFGPRRIEIGPVPRSDVRVQLESPGDGRGFTVFSWGGDAWSDIELVRLNEDLGRYFGTGVGLLVIRPPSDESIGLQSGDVIVAIDGREPRTPSRALRILRSYESGETVNLEIMRDQNRMTVSIDVPEREDHSRFFDWDRQRQFGRN